MTYRLPDLDVPADAPFRNDVLVREPLATFLSNFIQSIPGPFVLALDGPWGTGKTTLIRMLKAQLESQKAHCIYFDAWKVDFATDPLVALISAVEPLKREHDAFGGHLETVKKVTSLIARRSIVIGAKALTIGALDLEKETEEAFAAIAGDSISDIVDVFTKEKELIERFRSELESAVNTLPTDSDSAPSLIFFIDELDRCRPTFAIELLERVKHLFDIKGVIFVLSLDKQQLEASTSAVYGAGINSEEYLRRFIDLEYRLPSNNSDAFTVSLMDRFGIDKFFEKRTDREIVHDRDTYIKFFTSLADLLNLSLRARERCMTRFRIVMEQTKSNHYLDPVLVALLIVLRTKATSVFHNFVNSGDSEEVMTFIKSLSGGPDFANSHAGAVVQAFLLAADPSDTRKSNKIAALRTQAQRQDVPEPTRRHASTIIEICESTYRGLRSGISLSTIASKIDLAARIKY